MPQWYCSAANWGDRIMAKMRSRPREADPLPWLLEWENPSARYLTLRDLFDGGEQDPQTQEAQAAIPEWPPVRDILAVMDPVNFWGRADRPFYGGAVGTHGTLHLLAELGMPRTAQIEHACENLIEHGQHESGGFTYNGTPGRRLLCYTGNAIRTLIHFGYRGDERLELAVEYLAARSMTQNGLACPYAEGTACQWGITKALGAFAALPSEDRTPGRLVAVQRLADAVLNYEFDYAGRDARWLDFGFPLDYQSDLVELCDVLARLGYGTDARLTRLMDIVLAARSPDGRWIKRYGTRALQIERRGEPSKWLTIRALRAERHIQRAVTETERPRLRGEPETRSFKWE